MNAPLLHPTSLKQLQLVIEHKPHALLITGAKGSGKRNVSEYIAAQVLQTSNLATYPYFLEIAPQKTIGIDEVRQIKTFLAKRTVGKGAMRRVVVLLKADTLSGEAQNALLKILEEPPLDTMLILTTDEVQGLRTTIISRTQQLKLLPLSASMAHEQFKKAGYRTEDITSAYHLSGGQAGLLAALLENQANHELHDNIKAAKAFLKMSPYERLSTVDSLSKTKEEIDSLIEGLLRIASSGLSQAAHKNNTLQVKQFKFLARQLLQAKNALHKTANPKLVLTALAIHL